MEISEAGLDTVGPLENTSSRSLEADAAELSERPRSAGVASRTYLFFHERKKRNTPILFCTRRTHSQSSETAHISEDAAAQSYQVPFLRLDGWARGRCYHSRGNHGSSTNRWSGGLRLRFPLSYGSDGRSRSAFTVQSAIYTRNTRAALRDQVSARATTEDRWRHIRRAMIRRGHRELLFG